MLKLFVLTLFMTFSCKSYAVVNDGIGSTTVQAQKIQKTYSTSPAKY